MLQVSRKPIADVDTRRCQPSPPQGGSEFKARCWEERRVPPGYSRPGWSGRSRGQSQQLRSRPTKLPRHVEQIAGTCRRTLQGLPNWS